ncbi:hypothetical protein [Paenibacillus graminis]|uniref:hypothetical protein n=1 Tax=Paenibacillus graminis TaxID=189425 RepID=UPI002DBC79C7|nr:hypothetical protein [Paenibacillus graminis]MEC0168861.1 hypothetical protein [Paenibacillus graminis]
MSKLAELEAQVKEMAATVAGLTKSKDVLKEQELQQAGEIKELKDKASMEPSVWAQPAIKAAVEAGLLDTPSGGSYDFYRTLTVLHRAGLLITIHEGGK